MNRAIPLYLLAALSGATSAAAQPSDDPPAAPSPRADTVTPEDTAETPYWQAGKTRPFVSSTMDVGLWYFRPNLAGGWGRPHWAWGGLEVETRFAPTGAAEYAGAKLATPYLGLRAGGRYVFTTSRTFLPHDTTYTSDELDTTTEPQARYAAIEAQLDGSVPIGPVKVFTVLTGVMIQGVPERYHVFDETLKVVVDPPWVWRARLGAVVPILPRDRVTLGGAGEVIGIPERFAYIGRAGPVLSVNITRHLEAQATALFVVASPDSIGLDGAEFSQLGLRYRWATGEERPAFP